MKFSVGYESKVASYLWISEFSFFEAFVSDVVQELFEFHGGLDSLVTRAENRQHRWTDKLPVKLEGSRQKLRDSVKPAWADRYRKYSAELASEGYRFPSDLFSAYGLKMLAKQLKRLKAHEIPDLVVSAFQVIVPESLVDQYNNFREIRNDIAHGRPPVLTVRDVVKMHSVLCEFALKIQNRLVKHYFVFERYA
jgi:hypothetical protein